VGKENNYSEAIRDLENTLNGYDEKETRKIIMEFLKKHEEDYANKKSEEKDNDEEADEKDNNEEYEVYSNETLGFNDDYVPENYDVPEEDAESDDYDDYYDAEEVEEEEKITFDNISVKKKVSKPSVRSEEKRTYKKKEEKVSKSTAPTIAKIACVMVVILAGVVVFLFNRLNTVDEEIAKSKTNSTDSTDVTEYEAKINELQAQVTNLNSQLESYKAAVTDLSKEDTTEKASEAISEKDSNESKDTSSESSEPQKYVVKKGDNLSKISRHFYGSEGYVEEIKNANNIKGDVLSLGQELVIPEV